MPSPSPLQPPSHCLPFTSIPASGLLSRLWSLSLAMDPPSLDGLQSLPQAWSGLTALTALHLAGHHGLRKIPHWIGALASLQAGGPAG